MLIELSIAWTAALNIIAWTVIQFGLAWGFTQLAAERFNLSFHSRQIFFLPARDRELCPVLGKCPCYPARDPCPATCYKRNLSL